MTESNPAAHADLSEQAPLRRAEHRESSFTRLIEQQVAKVPSHLFLSAALISMAVSGALELQGRNSASRFVGLWAGPLLTMGVYNKLVKTLGSY